MSLFYQVHFYLFGLIAIASALAFVTRRSPIAAALWLVNTLFCIAALYVLMDAHFLGAIQVLVYAGAIMVVFLFVVMLLNLGHPSEIADVRGKAARLAAGAVGLLLLVELWILSQQRGLPATDAPPPEVRPGTLDAVAGPLFREYLLAFEVTSVLLLAAIIGAVVLAKRRA